jgi:hypothetical protein
MGQRVNLQIVNDQLVLVAVIECRALRLAKKMTTFIIDTGSNQTLLSDASVKALQISLDGRATAGHVRFGGATYDNIPLPKTTMYILLDDWRSVKKLQVTFSAVRTRRIEAKKKEAAEALPSIIGIDFLKAHSMALHYLPKENLAYLEFDE